MIRVLIGSVVWLTDKVAVDAVIPDKFNVTPSIRSFIELDERVTLTPLTVSAASAAVPNRSPNASVVPDAAVVAKEKPLSVPRSPDTTILYRPTEAPVSTIEAVIPRSASLSVSTTPCGVVSTIATAVSVPEESV